MKERWGKIWEWEGTKHLLGFISTLLQTPNSVTDSQLSNSAMKVFCFYVQAHAKGYKTLSHTTKYHWFSYLTPWSILHHSRHGWKQLYHIWTAIHTYLLDTKNNFDVTAPTCTKGTIQMYSKNLRKSKWLAFKTQAEKNSNVKTSLTCVSFTQLMC